LNIPGFMIIILYFNLDGLNIAGPCAVENRDMLFDIAKSAKEAGAKILRGGTYKFRTNHQNFQGLKEEGLKILSDVGKSLDMPVATEVTCTEILELVVKYVDILQIGTRNMHNTCLLEEAAKTKKPILLKRGMSAKISEFLMACEYILKEGNDKIILCERGIRTFENSTRNTLDISAVPNLKEKVGFPVFVDPSHSTGKWEYVSSMAKASVAAGADGLLIEVHNDPENALSDGEQSLKPKKFKALMKELKAIAKAIGRKIN